jgi:hypothetical protein
MGTVVALNYARIMSYEQFRSVRCQCDLPMMFRSVKIAKVRCGETDEVGQKHIHMPITF